MKILASRRAPIVLVILMVAVVGLLFGYSYWEGREKPRRLSGQAPAVITSVYVNTTRTSRGRTRHTTHVIYTYEVNGRVISGKSVKSGDLRDTYQARMPAKACYDPSNPEESEVFLADVKCGQ